MNFDIGEVVGRAWQITWKHKVLWMLATLFGLFVSFMLLFMFLPALFPMLVRDSRTELAIFLLVLLIVVILLFILVMYPVSAFVQTSLTLGVLNSERNGERYSAFELIQKSLPFFWRVLGLIVLFGVGMTLATVVIQLVILFLSIVTFGLGSFLSVFMYPLMYGVILWMEQAMNGVVIDDMPIMNAIRQGWDLMRNNVLSMVVLALIVYLGAGMIMGIAMLPMVVPFFMLPMSFAGHEVNWSLAAVSAMCSVAMIPLLAILMGGSLVFTKSVWVLTYLRLTRAPRPQVVPQIVTP